MNCYNSQHHHGRKLEVAAHVKVGKLSNGKGDVTENQMKMQQIHHHQSAQDPLIFTKHSLNPGITEHSMTYA